MKKLGWSLFGFFMVVFIGYFSGPMPPDPVYSNTLPALPNDLSALANYVNQSEAAQDTRKDNEARIRWYNDSMQVTDYSFVYLHGFAGSYRDGYPVNVQVADTFGANVYLARWAGHGLQPAVALQDFSPEAAWASAKEALVVGQRIGRKVIIMSTSTGGTLAIKLAAEFPDAVHGIINMSPNIEDDQPGAFLLNSPWGYELAKLVSLGEERKISHEEPIALQYWDTIYPSKALVNLQVLLATTMEPATFKKLNCPVLTLYYHKNLFKEDEHVEISVYPEVHELFTTPDSLVELIELPNPGTHFIGSDIKSKDIRSVEQAIIRFCTQKLGINLRRRPISQSG